ncbi:hypothetical protein M0R19_03870 [Candidatus Pacearchaeota archaeon]|nr:hypothetical protein [Candidatus Pacearchaeota archaeon]
MTRFLKCWNKFVINESFGNLNNLCLYFYKDNDGEVTISLLNTIKLKKFIKAAQNFTDNDFDEEKHVDFIIGMIIASKTTAYEDGRCFDSMEVSNSAVDEKYQGKGYGKLIYGLLAAYISISKCATGITADRSTTSEKAERVWDSIDHNEDWEPVIPKKGFYIGKFDDINAPKTRPEKDDCKIKKYSRLYSDKLNPEHLNQVYSSDKFVNEFNELRSNYVKLGIKDSIKKGLITMIDNFFWDIYYDD